MKDNRTKPQRHGSIIIGAINRFTAFIYSFFSNGRIGNMLSSDNTLCKRSYLAGVFSQKRVRTKRVLLKYPESLMEKGIASRAILFFREFMASLKMNVYGMFFTFLGLSSAIALLIPAITEGFSALDDYALITSGIITLCAIPMLFSSKSATEALIESRMMKKVVLDILCIPAEKLKIQKRYGGTVCMFVSAIIAMGLGALSYFIDPITVPVIFLALVAVLAVFSSPETGVIITLALTPFMQYMSQPKAVLLTAIVLTALSYFCKVFRRRRAVSLSPEISTVLLFCAFILVTGCFSVGGLKTFTDSLQTVIIILGGFFLTYNLINTEKMLAACLKTLAVSLLFLCMVGIWESVFYGISNRIIDTMTPNISQITEENILYIADDGIVFGLFIILIFPILLSYISNRKTVKSISMMTIFCIVAVIAAWMCSHYEIMVALVLEIFLFWLLYTHKAMTAIIIAAIPIGIAVVLYPYAVKYWGIPDVSSILMEYMPASISDSKMHSAVINDVLIMLKDGNYLGIGAGDYAFGIMFPAYAEGASQGAEHPMSLWLQVLCWSGIFGFFAFALFSIFIIKRTLGFIRDPYNKELRSKATALFCGLSAAILLGCVYSIWIDERLLYLFWVCVGLLVSYIRLGKTRELLRRSAFKSTESEKDIEVLFVD